MENKPILWDKNSPTLQTLRQPRQPNTVPGTLENQNQNNIRLTSNTVPSYNEYNEGIANSVDNRLINSVAELSIDENKLKTLVANSTLKPTAPEFFPSNSGRTKPASSVQNRLKVHRFSQEVDHVQSLDMREKDYSNVSSDQHYHAIQNSSDFIRLKHIITTLTRDPGQFDNLLELFMETLFPYLEDVIASSRIAHLLVDQAINNSNFRYTGARLCWYVEQSCPNFRAELHLYCKKQLEDNRNKQNILMFIAELYIQLPHLNVYGSLLINSFKQLLSEGGNDNIKCICQALKLTGHSLERSNKNDLDEVFAQLMSSRNSINGSALTLLNSVVNLRASNWGRSNESVNNSESTSEGFYYGGLHNTVFYHTDGHTFTNEEKEFLAAHVDQCTEYLSDTSDPDELCDPEPEMDEEIQAAFKEFVKFSRH